MSAPCPRGNYGKVPFGGPTMGFWAFWRYVFTGAEPGVRYEYRLPDIVGRLRSTSQIGRRGQHEAADEIEQLKSIIAESQDEHLKYIGETTADIERLRAQLASARKALEFVRDGYERSDVTHISYRVRAHRAALDAIAEIDDQRSGK